MSICTREYRRTGCGGQGALTWVLIAQLQRDNNILEALVHPATPPEKLAERKSVIEELAMQLDEMEQEVKKVRDATT